MQYLPKPLMLCAALLCFSTAAEAECQFGTTFLDEWKWHLFQPETYRLAVGEFVQSSLISEEIQDNGLGATPTTHRVYQTQFSGFWPSRTGFDQGFTEQVLVTSAESPGLSIPTGSRPMLNRQVLLLLEITEAGLQWEPAACGYGRRWEPSDETLEQAAYFFRLMTRQSLE